LNSSSFNGLQLLHYFSFDLSIDLAFVGLGLTLGFDVRACCFNLEYDRA